MKKIRNLYVVLLIILLSSSCRTAKDITMFQEAQEEFVQHNIPPESYDFKIKPFDNLYINISTIDPEVNKLFNPNSRSQNNSQNSTQQFGSPVGQYLYGYRVSVDSTVFLPVLGKVKLVGLDLEEAQEKITVRAKEYLKEPNIQVKFLNFKVNLSGEINGQGLIYNYEERLNIYDAISMGGGITQFADLRNVTIQRFDGNRVFTHKLDLTDYSSFSSDVYYLQPNDIVYIPPSKLKMRSVNTGNYSIFLGTISFLMVLMTYLNIK